MEKTVLYIFPKVGDIPKEGDEYLGLRASETWTKIPNPLKQSAYDENDVGYVRRPLTDIVEVDNLMSKMFLELSEEERRTGI